MRWLFLTSLGVLAALAAPSVGSSVNSGDLPDLPAAFRGRLTKLLDLEAGPLAATGGASVEEALQRAHAASADRQAPHAARAAAAATLVEARLLVRGLEKARRCHRFYHEPAAHWALCCSLTGRAPRAETVRGRSRLCVAVATAGIQPPRAAPVHGVHYLRITNTRPLRPRNEAGAVLVNEDDPLVARMLGKRGWACQPRGERGGARRRSPPVRVAAPAGGGAPAVAAAAVPSVSVRATEEVVILPIGGTFLELFTAWACTSLLVHGLTVRRDVGGAASGRYLLSLRLSTPVVELLTDRCTFGVTCSTLTLPHLFCYFPSTLRLCFVCV